ncbi:MAG: inositol monophosphatase family protein [Bacteroidota bacterium]
MNLEAVCHQVEALARVSGEYLLAAAREFDNSTVEKKGHNDLVSHVDRTSEIMLVEGLGPLVPDAGFITEEKTKLVRGERYEWIIDPLDGTTNFIHGVPLFCISIALYENGTPVLGVVYEPNQDECFSAWKNGGAYLNGDRIRVSSTPSLSESLLATGFPYHDYDRMEPYMHVFDYCMRNTRGLRRLGSAAADLAYVAAGRFDAFYEYGLNPYDVAGGIVLVQEAGGKVTDFKGGPDATFSGEIIASNNRIHEEFLEVIRRHFGA